MLWLSSTPSQIPLAIPSQDGNINSQPLTKLMISECLRMGSMSRKHFFVLARALKANSINRWSLFVAERSMRLCATSLIVWADRSRT